MFRRQAEEQKTGRINCYHPSEQTRMIRKVVNSLRVAYAFVTIHPERLFPRERDDIMVLYLCSQ